MTDLNKLLGKPVDETKQVPDTQIVKPALSFGVKSVVQKTPTAPAPVTVSPGETPPVQASPAVAFAQQANAATPVAPQAAVPVNPQPTPPVPETPAAPASLIDVSQSLTLPTDSFNHPSQPSNFALDQMTAIKNSIAVLAANIEDKNIVSDAIRNVLLTMMQNPETAELIEAGDIQMMTRGLRASHGAVLAVKQTRKKTTTAKAQRIDDTLEKLKSFNF